MTSFAEIMAELEKWHRDHPWRSRWRRLTGWLRDAFRFTRRAPVKAWQRARRGYSTPDLWSFDVYICGVIGRAVLDLQANGHGYPVDATEEEWHDLLTAIAEPLLAYSEGKFAALDRDSDFAQYEAAKNAMRLFADNLGGMWD